MPRRYGLEERDLLAAEETFQRIYNSIFGKSEKAVTYEQASRPDDP